MFLRRRALSGNPLAVVLEPAGLERGDADHCPRIQSVGDGVRLSARRSGTSRRHSHFHAGARTAVRRPPDRRHRGAARLHGRRRQARLRAWRGRSARCRCRVSIDGKDRGHARSPSRNLPTLDGKPGGRDAVAAALGLSASDIGLRVLPPPPGRPACRSPWSRCAGLRRSAAASPTSPIGTRPSAASVGSAFVFCKESVDAGSDFHARMFAPRMGVAEDPATGSAVAAFAGLLAASGAYARRRTCACASSRATRWAGRARSN